MGKVDSYIKAVVAALIAGLGAIQTALSDGHVTSQEYVTAAVAALAGLGLVYAVPNTPAPGAPQPGDTLPQEGLL